MNERDQACQLPIAKAVITHGARGFSNEAVVPVVGMQAIADLDVFDGMLWVVKETAVTYDHVLTARDDGKLRGNPGAIPAHDFFEESNRLFAFSENA
jgi:hypothetical protein